MAKKGWRTANLLPIKREYDEVNGRMKDTGEWDWAVPNVISGIADIPDQIRSLGSHQLGTEYTNEDIGNMLGLSGFGFSPLRAAGGRGISLASKPQYKEMLHGSSGYPVFDKIRPGKGGDIHLAEDPYVADAFSIGEMHDPVGMGGGRVYPVLADPGNNVFKREWGMIDPAVWDDPAAVLERLKDDYTNFPNQITPQLQGVMDDLAAGLTPVESMKKRGYTSMEYSHPSFNPNNPGNDVTAHLFTNPEQIIPKYSSEGMLAQKEGRVKPIDYNKYPSKWDTEMVDPYAKQSVDDFDNPKTLETIKLNPTERQKQMLKYWGIE